MTARHEMRIILLAAAIMAGLVLLHEDPVHLASTILFGPAAG